MTTGDAYLFHRLGGFSGGVLLDEPLLPASSLTRNTRNTRVFIAISPCGDRRTNTARRRGVPLAPTAPASVKTNRAVRVGHAVSSESKRTAILTTGFVAS